MPPPLALLICTIFVVLLLKLEHKQFPEAPHALWIPTIWMLLILSKPLGIWFSSGGVDMESGSPLDRVFLNGIFCLALLILIIRYVNGARAPQGNIWVLILLGYMLLSILWSDMPYTSFKRWFRELIAVIMALLVSTEPNPRQAVECMLRRITYILIPFSLLLIKYYPHFGVEYAHWSGMQMWIGVALQKNSMALLCIISFFLPCVEALQKMAGT